MVEQSKLPSNLNPSSFYSEGYALCQSALPTALLDAFITIIEERVDKIAAERYRLGGISSLYEDLPFTRRLGALYAGEALETRGWDDLLFCPQFHTLITSPYLIRCLLPFLGREITYQGNGHLRPYLPCPLEKLAWHQDAQFYGSGTEYLLWNMLQVWIPLVDVGPKNGCIALVPGSHRWGLLRGAVDGEGNIEGSSIERQASIRDCAAEAVADHPVVLIPMNRGDVLIFTCLTVHTGTENQSGLVRWSLDLRFETTRGAKPLSDMELRAYEVMHRRIRGRGYIPLRVSSGSGPETWEDWVAQRQAVRTSTTSGRL